jgi:nucleoside-diphosphate-sugar epimerase
MAADHELLLITGATGYLGYLVLVGALKKGYHIRIAVRSEAKAQKLLSSSSIKALNPSKEQLSWVIVPDMAAPGAYDEAVKGVKYIIHLASPIPTFGGPNPPAKEQYEAYFIKPAKEGDIGMLQSAANEPSVKRIVITSSVVAIIPFDYLMGTPNGDPNRVFTSSDRIAFDKGPWEFEFQAYSAGKAAALNEAEAFVKENKPQFDLIPIIPGWIFGRDDRLTHADELKSESTNSVLLSFLTGFENPIPYSGNLVSGPDVARVHVEALNPAIKGNRAFLTSVDATWEDAHSVMKTKYADAVAAGILSLNGKQGTIDIKVPSTETEEVFNFRFQPYERMVTEVVDQYLTLSASA